MNIAIIYHDADFDGKLSNEVCRYWLKKLHPDAQVHSYGWDYGRPLPSVLPEYPPGSGCGSWSFYDSIYIVDLSVDELMARPELRDKIVWIDHHKSAIEKWDEKFDGANPFDRPFTGYRIDGVAACRLCWQWFNTEPWFNKTEGSSLPVKDDYVARLVPEPELIRLAGEYDVWDHRDPDAKALQFGLRTLLPHEFNLLLDEQFNGPFESSSTSFLTQTISHGDLIKSYCDLQNREYAAKHAHTIQWEGLKFCALNTSGRSSDHFDGALNLDHDACFCWRFDGRVVSVSLYSVPGKDIDLSTIATKYGGGGHRGACGFRVSLAQLESILGSSPERVVS